MSSRNERSKGSQQLRTRYKDEQGHYERWSEMRVHPDLDTAVKTFLNDPRCEFGSLAELIRGCVLEALPRFQMGDPRTKSVLAILRACEEENNRSEMRRNFKKLLENSAKEAFELVGEGRDSEAAMHIHRILGHIRGMDKEDPWRAEFVRTVKQKFGHLLKRGKAASLVPTFEAEEESDEWINVM